MINIYTKTIEELKSAAISNDSILVSYSGGKDSMVVLDLCAKIFKRVVCFFMYVIPGLSVIEKQLDYARGKYCVEIIQYPHWLLSRWLKDGYYCLNYTVWDNIPTVSIANVWALARAETGINLIATGQRRSDDVFRYLLLSKKQNDIIHPLRDWHRYDVLAYLQHNNLPVPDASRKEKAGIDLSEQSLLWLHDNHPKDFQKLLKIFPFAEAPIYRREFYGQEIITDKAARDSKRFEKRRHAL